MRPNFKIPKEDDEVTHLVNICINHGSDMLKSMGEDEIRLRLSEIVELAKDAGVFEQKGINFSDGPIDEMVKMFSGQEDVSDTIEFISELIKARDRYAMEVESYTPTAKDLDWVKNEVLGPMQHDTHCIITDCAAYMIDRKRKQVRRIMTNLMKFRPSYQVKMAAIFKSVGYEMVDTGSA